MRLSLSNRMLIAGIIVCGLFAFLLGRFGDRFNSRWSKLSDGMTQEEVRQALGSPTWIGNSGCTGAGDRMVTRWQYRRREVWRHVYYCVDFDYIGPGGAPVVFRTERFWETWEWPSWWPGQRTRARA